MTRPKKMFVNTNCALIHPLNPPILGDFEQKRLKSPPELAGLIHWKSNNLEKPTISFGLD